MGEGGVKNLEKLPTLFMDGPLRHGVRPDLLEIHLLYTNSLVNVDSFYTNFNNTTFQKFPIPNLTRTMKQKFLH